MKEAVGVCPSDKVCVDAWNFSEGKYVYFRVHLYNTNVI